MSVLQQIDRCRKLKIQIHNIKVRQRLKLWTLLDKHPNLAWSWKCLFAGKDAILPLCIKHATTNKRWSLLTASPAVTMTLIESTLHDDKYHWDLTVVASNPNVTIDFVNKYLLNLPLSTGITNMWSRLSFNSDLDLTLFMHEFPNANWNWRKLSFNKNLTPEFVVKYQDKPWDWHVLSSHRNLTFGLIDTFPDKPWNWSTLAQGKLVLFVISKYPDKPWDTDDINHNRHLRKLLTGGRMSNLKSRINNNQPIDHIITTLDIYDAEDKDYDSDYDDDDNNDDDSDNEQNIWYKKSTDPNLDVQYMLDNPHLPWNWYEISQHPKITMSDIEQHLDLEEYKWRWQGMLCNPNFTMDFVSKHVDKPWLRDCKRLWEKLSYYDFQDQTVALQVQYKLEVRKLAKMFYWRLVESMSKPPNGYYFLNDLRSVITDIDQRQMFDTLRTDRNFKQIQIQFLS